MPLRTLLAGLAVLLLSTAAAQEIPTPGCQTGEAAAELNVAGVRAGLFNLGGLFWRGGGTLYEVPNGSGKTPLFNASLMVGGLVEGQVRFAGSTYSAWEYWPGPLTSDGTTTPATCAAYDRIWVVRTADLEAYDATGAVTPDLADWPVRVGAPFYVDADGDGHQDPTEPTNSLDPGDPGYGSRTLDLGAGERPVLFGRQTAWWIMNDAGGPHSFSARSGPEYAAPLGIEVRATAWVHGGEAEPDLFESTFYRYEVINRSATTIEAAHAGLWIDGDLGNFGDDRVGTDSTRQMVYFYNGDDTDEGQGGYGTPPPAIGVDALSGAWTGTTPNKSSGPYGEPRGALHSYNYLRGLWGDGSPIRVGGPGFDTDGPVTRWMFSGRAASQEFWSQENLDGEGAQSPPDDKRGMISSLPADLAPGERMVFDVGIVFATGLSRLDSINEMLAVSDRAQALYDTGALTAPVADPAAPASPQPLGPSIEAPAQGDAATFAWEGVPGAERYVVEVFSDADGSDLLFERSTVETTLTEEAEAFPINRRAPLYWRVRAVRFGVESAPTALQAFAYVVPGFDRFSVVANASGPLDPPLVSSTGVFSGLAGADRQQTTEMTWNVFFQGGLRGTNAAAAYPSDFEIRFSAPPHPDDIALRHSTGERIRVPFSLWDIGVGTPDDPADDVRLVPVVHDEGGDGYEAYYDAVSWYRPTDMAPGSRGYRDWTTPTDRTLPDSSRLVLPRMSFDLGSGFALSPEAGTVFRFESSAQALPVAEPEVPGTLTLELRPNPTTVRATVAYRLATAGAVRLRVVDVIGREVMVLVDETQPEGEHRAGLDAASLAPGTYVLVLDADGQRVSRAITVVR